jgi:hypothetical protein
LKTSLLLFESQRPACSYRSQAEKLLKIDGKIANYFHPEALIVIPFLPGFFFFPNYTERKNAVFEIIKDKTILNYLYLHSCASKWGINILFIDFFSSVGPNVGDWFLKEREQLNYPVYRSDEYNFLFFNPIF